MEWVCVGIGSVLSLFGWFLDFDDCGICSSSNCFGVDFGNFGNLGIC